MNITIGYVAGAIATVAGIWFGIWMARAAVREEHRRNVNTLGNGIYILPPRESATKAQEDETEERKAA